MATPAMGIIRKILIFLVLTAGIIMLGRLAPRILPSGVHKSRPEATHLAENTPIDSTNALPDVVEDTTGGKWQQKLFTPLLRSYRLPEKHIQPKHGYFEIVLPKGRPIHDYALDIENLCRKNGIVVEQGVELYPTGRKIEYMLNSNGQHMKLRASLGTVSLAGSAKLAIVFIELDSLQEKDLAGLESANWDKSLTVNAFSPNQNLKKLRYTSARNEILLELPMEPSSYPFVDPGKHALFIHHSKADVSKFLGEGLDSLPKAMGFVTKYGDRAIENLPLLDKLFQYTAGKNLVFLDLTGSPRSLARQSAAAHGAKVRGLQPFRDSLHIDEELVRKAIQAEKTGEAVLVLPYSSSGFLSLESALATNATSFMELGLELVTYSALLSVPGDSVLPDVTAPIAKPKLKPNPKPDLKAKPGPIPSLRPSARPSPKVKPKVKPKVGQNKSR